MSPPPVCPRRSPVLIAVRSFWVFALLAATTWAAEVVSYQLNDRVETNVSNFGWQKGTIIELGQGAREGQAKVHGDGFPKDYPGWVRLPPKGRYIRKLAGAAPAPPESPPPRLGKYDILSFGAGGKYLVLGHIELQVGGKYRVSRTGDGDYFGEGDYTFDAAAKTIHWGSGPYQDTSEWGGAFEVDREGRTHKITLRIGTVATNRTD